MEDLRNSIKEAGGLYLKQLYEEIEEYFQMVPRIYNYTIRTELDLPKHVILHKFNLLDNLYDPLYLPELLELTTYIKENNFEYFDSRWNTYGYYHHTHGYKLKELISKLKPLSDKILLARNQKLDQTIKNVLKSDNERIVKSSKLFITEVLDKYDLVELENYKNLINEAAYNKHFYKLLPILLRTLFENLLWIIYRDSLNKKHIELYFNKYKSRVRDFSELIKLLDILKDKDFNPYCKNIINQGTIDFLNKIKQIGNWSVHEVLEQIDPNFADEKKDATNRVLNALIVLYKSIKNKEILINEENITKIRDKLHLKSEKEKEIMDTEVVQKRDEVSIVIKDLEASINSRTIIGGFDDIFISIKAVNKTIRPIIINSYGIEIINKEVVVIISPFHSKLKFINTPLPCRLRDGESCNAYISRPAFEAIMKEQSWLYPLNVRAVFQTNDEKFFSEEISLKKIKV